MAEERHSYSCPCSRGRAYLPSSQIQKIVGKKSRIIWSRAFRSDRFLILDRASGVIHFVKNWPVLHIFLLLYKEMSLNYSLYTVGTCLQKIYCPT
jgi:hypothetical protein